MLNYFLWYCVIGVVVFTLVMIVDTILFSVYKIPHRPDDVITAGQHIVIMTMGVVAFPILVCWFLFDKESSLNIMLANNTSKRNEKVQK